MKRELAAKDAEIEAKQALHDSRLSTLQVQAAELATSRERIAELEQLAHQLDVALFGEHAAEAPTWTDVLNSIATIHGQNRRLRELAKFVREIETWKLVATKDAASNRAWSLLFRMRDFLNANRDLVEPSSGK